MERKLDELWQMQRVMNQQVPDTEALPQEETSGMDTETVAVTAPAIRGSTRQTIWHRMEMYIKFI